VTSTAGWIRRLGGKRWQTLHRLIYVAGLTAILHYWWLVKADVTSPQRYAIVIGVLLVFRLAWARSRARRPASARPQPAAQSPKSAA
jgi:sulfoxide reductase heme-binding subunit YedZ